MTAKRISLWKVEIPVIISWSEQRVRLESCEVDVMTALHCVCVYGRWCDAKMWHRWCCQSEMPGRSARMSSQDFSVRECQSQQGRNLIRYAASTYHVQKGLTQETLQETMTLVSCCGQSKWVVVSGERRELGPVIHVCVFVEKSCLLLLMIPCPSFFIDVTVVAFLGWNHWHHAALINPSIRMVAQKRRNVWETNRGCLTVMSFLVLQEPVRHGHLLQVRSR